MERSSRALVAGGTLAILLVACQAVIGLDRFKKDNNDCDFMDCAMPPDAADAMAEADAPDYFGDASAAHRWVAWPMPNPADAETDANIAAYGVPFEAGVDGGKTMVVRDLVTKLEWMVTAGPSLPFPEALAYCDGLGNNFRLPTRIELASLWDYATPTAPTFDKSVFVGAAGLYWTQSPGLPDKTTAWVVDFVSGNVQRLSVAQLATVRCVR